MISKPKPKRDDEEHIDFGAAFAAMMMPAQSDATYRASGDGGSAEGTTELHATAATPPEREPTIITPNEHRAFDGASTARAKSGPSSLSFQLASAAGASPTAITEPSSSPQALASSTIGTIPPEATTSVRSGFWSGLLRAAESLLSSGRSEPESRLTPDSQPGTNEQLYLAKRVEPVAVDQSGGTEPQATKGLNSNAGRETSPSAQTSWLQLVETTAPLSEVPALISKLSNQLTKPIPPSAESEALLHRANAAANASQDPRPMSEVDPPSRGSNSVLDSGRHLAASKLQRRDVLGERVEDPSVTGRPQEATILEPAARVTVSASSSKGQGSPATLLAGQRTVTHKVETSVATAGIGHGGSAGSSIVTTTVPAAPQITQSAAAPRSVAAATPVHSSTTASHLPASSRTASLRLDLFEGVSAQANVRERAGVVDVRIVTNNHSLAQHLDGELAALRRNFDAGGLQLQSADVTYSGQDGHGRSKREGEQQAPARRENADSSVVFGLGEVGK